jgi:AraC-like DNA-binding protein
MLAVPSLTFLPVAPVPAGLQDAVHRHAQCVRVLRPGLQVHADDAAEGHDFTASGSMEAGLRLVVLLEGAVDVSYGARRVAMNSGGRGAQRCQPRALLVSVARPECFERRARRGMYARRVSVGMGGEWLEQVAGADGAHAIDAFRRQHLAMHHWQPSPRIAALAEQITHVPDLSPLLLHLYLESRALELVGEALENLAQHAPGPVPVPAPLGCAATVARLLPHEHERMRTLHAYLQTDGATDLTLDALASRLGTNANTLQRHFRAVYGTTVFDFVREHRLHRARRALEQEGLTVGQAALVAGYNSAANFATAFRRRFGMPPKLARGRV